MDKILSVIAGLFVSVTSLFSPVAPTPTPTPTPIAYYQVKGETERYPYRIRYILWIPKAGGEVKGDIRGYVLTGKEETCSASLSGPYQGDTITGDISGTCSILFINQKIAGTFTGNVNLDKQYVDGWVNGNVGNVAFSEYVYLSLY